MSAVGSDMAGRRVPSASIRGSDPDKLAGNLDAGVGMLSQTGATVVLFTGPGWGSTPVPDRNRAKAAIFHENAYTIASRHGDIANLWALRQPGDRRMRDPDRLHLSPLGQEVPLPLSAAANPAPRGSGGAAGDAA